MPVIHSLHAGASNFFVPMPEFRCSSCFRSFSCNGNLNRHRRVKHGIRAEPVPPISPEVQTVLTRERRNRYQRVRRAFIRKRSKFLGNAMEDIIRSRLRKVFSSDLCFCHNSSIKSVDDVNEEREQADQETSVRRRQRDLINRILSISCNRLRQQMDRNRIFRKEMIAYLKPTSTNSNPNSS